MEKRRFHPEKTPSPPYHNTTSEAEGQEKYLGILPSTGSKSGHYHERRSYDEKKGKLEPRRNRERHQCRKGRSLTVIVACEAVVQTVRENAGKREMGKQARGNLTASSNKGWCKLKSSKRRKIRGS